MATYTLKKVRFESEKANILENKLKRKRFVEKLLQYQAENSPICFMDESNTNIHISRREGRSLRGTRCTTIAAGSKGANVHMIGCMSNAGLLHYEIKWGAFKSDQACEWMRRCLRITRFKFDGPVVMVIDNAPCHSGLENVFEEPEFSDNHLLRLGPYSPMFNPMENVWSSVKAKIKRDLATKITSILRIVPQGLSIKEHRLRALEELMKEGMSAVTSGMCSNFAAQIFNNVADAINMMDVEF